LVSLDCGIGFDCFISDQAVSVETGQVSAEIKKLNRITNESFYKGIEAVKPHGYGIVHEYCGHGVGLVLHEDPHVPNTPHGANPKMTNGMVFAIEPMINLGTRDIEVLEDDWTVVTADAKISAHWEHTIAIFNGKTEILTERLEGLVF